MKPNEGRREGRRGGGGGLSAKDVGCPRNCELSDVRKLRKMDQAYLSSCFMPRWMQIEGKLHSPRSLFSSRARVTDLTKMTICTKGIGEAHTLVTKSRRLYNVTSLITLKYGYFPHFAYNAI